jgi:hypothetical protein
MSPFARIILGILSILMTAIMIGAFRAGKKKATYKVIVYLSIFAVLFTASSLFWTTDIAYDIETITHLEFGWPIPFRIQDLSVYNPPFPYPMRADFAGYSRGGVFVWENFIFSIIINFIFVIALWQVAISLVSRRGNR